jgi:hypothetical protein
MKVKKIILSIGILGVIIAIWFVFSYWHIKGLRDEKSLMAVSEATLMYIRNFGVPPRHFADLFNSGYLVKKGDLIILLSENGIHILGGPWDSVKNIRFSFPQHADDLEFKDGRLIEKATGSKKELLIGKNTVFEQDDIDKVNLYLWEKWRKLD